MQLQQDNINTVISKSYSCCRATLSTTQRELQQREARNAPAPRLIRSEDQSSKNSVHGAVLPCLRSIQQNQKSLIGKEENQKSTESVRPG